MDSILPKCVDSPHGLRSRSKYHVTVSHFNTGYMKQSTIIAVQYHGKNDRFLHNSKRKSISVNF